MNQQLLSKTQCAALRGIAIVCIVLHNYCHFLNFAVKENEYTFDPSKPRRLMNMLTTVNADWFVHLFSFFGHYGVPVFLFVSGFGLVMKYEKSGAPMPSGLRFSTYHYLKLLRLMFFGYVAFIVYSLVHTGSLQAFTPYKVVAHLLMVANFMPDPDHFIYPGPYWFFSLMLQLYVVYRLLVFKQSWKQVVALVFICWMVQALCRQDFESLNRVRYNFFGAMLPFCAGVLYARHAMGVSRVANWLVLAFSVVLVFVLGFWFHGWLWAPLFVVSGAVAFVKLSPAWLLKPCAWVGAISAAMFVVHPLMRAIIIPLSYRGHVFMGIALYFAATLLFSWLFARLLSFVPKPKIK